MKKFNVSFQISTAHFIITTDANDNGDKLYLADYIKVELICKLIVLFIIPVYSFRVYRF